MDIHSLEYNKIRYKKMIFYTEAVNLQTLAFLTS